MSHLIKELNVLKCRIDNVNDSVAVDRNVLGAHESARNGRVGSKSTDQLPLLIKLLELALHDVHHIDEALLLDRDGQRTHEGAGLAAGTFAVAGGWVEDRDRPI